MAAQKPYKVVAFVDGFNLYHFIKKYRHLRQYLWLDLIQFVKRFLPPDAIILRVLYFSAYPLWNKPKVDRHRLYVRALKSKGVEIYLGDFKETKKTVSINDRLRLGIKSHEEKQTDVSIGVEMILSSYKDNYDIAMLISGDTDFIPPIMAIKREFPKKKIWVVVPNKKLARPYQRLKDRQIIDKLATIKRFHLKTSQFPPELELKSGAKITKPEIWD